MPVNEVVRNDGLKGLLFIWSGRDCVCMRLEYFSPDERLSGLAFFVVDAGARKALVESGRSLLPSGVRSVHGQFRMGDPVDIAVDPGRPFARGLAGYGADEVRRIAGLKTSEIERALGYKYLDEVVHRDDLVVLEQGRE